MLTHTIRQPTPTIPTLKMAGSSMRNSVHRRNHKERAQPLARAKLGLLEKHGDYVKRARDYHSKRDRIKKLREKVAFRNKDEFYWGMIKQRTTNGVHVQTRGNESLPNEIVQLLKSQDSGYMRTQIAADESKINALKTHLHSLSSLIRRPGSSSDAEDNENAARDQLHGIDDRVLVNAGLIAPKAEAPGRKQGKGKSKSSAGLAARGHTVFAEGRDELLAYERPLPMETEPISIAGPSQSKGNVAEVDEELGWMVRKRKSKRSAVAEEAKISELDLARLEIEQDVEERLLLAEARQHRQTLLTELSARIERLAALKGTLAHMTVERQMMRKSSVVIKREKEQVVADDDHEGGQGAASRKVEWRPQVVKWRAERRR